MWVPVPAGPLKGRRWDPASGGKLLRVLLGTYEPEQTRRLLETLSAGDVFFDVGAHVGWYSLAAAGRIAPGGRVVAFEASRRNHRYLARHLALNRLSEVEALHLGVADTPGRRAFTPGSGTGTGRLSDEGSETVEVTSLDAYCRAHDLWPKVVKIDVEGGEVEVLDGAAELLAAHRPTLFLSTHGEGLKAACLDRLRPFGYRADPLDRRGADLHCYVPD